MRQTKPMYILLGTLLLLSGVGLGLMLSQAQPFGRILVERKPFADVQAVQSRVDNNSQIIYEQAYEECKHVVISEFPHAADLIGKTEDEIRLQYNERSGFQLTITGNTIILRQTIPGWCPKEYERARLKEYQGRLAIYKGPDAEHDELLRVTDIRAESLPAGIMQAIRGGQYEFESEAMLNDALENLDEYL